MIIKINNNQMFDSQEFNLCTENQHYIYKLLRTKIRFQEVPLTEEDLNPDIILKIRVPSQKQRVFRLDQIPIDYFAVDIPKDLDKVYKIINQMAFYEDSEKLDKPKSKINQNSQEDLQTENNQFKKKNQLLTKHLKSLKPNVEGMKIQKSKAFSQRLQNGQINQGQMIFQCKYKLQAEMDIFTLNYNTIVYTLQNHCGFKTRSFLLENKKSGQKYIYVLVRLQEKNAMKMATKYRIKKACDPSYIDFFVDDPVDKKGRPFKYNKLINKREQFIKDYKRISRNFSIRQNFLGEQIHQEVQLGKETSNHFQSYTTEVSKLFKEIKEKKVEIQQYQKQYIEKLCRSKYNKGSQNFFLMIKKKHEFLEKKKLINDRYGYKNYQYPNCYTEFSYPDRRQPFFDKLQHLLFFIPTISPMKDKLTLFQTMDKVKLAFLSLKQHFKVDTLQKLGVQVFTIHNKAELFGCHLEQEYKNQQQKQFQERMQKKKRQNRYRSYLHSATWMNHNQQLTQDQIEENKNDVVCKNYHFLVPFFSKIQKVRNYFGEQISFMLLIKIHIFTIFFVLTPLGIAGQIIKYLFFQDRSGFWKIQIIYFGVIFIIFNFFIVLWQSKEKQFRRNFVDSQNKVEFKSDYKGPYQRNIIEDEVNQFQRSVGYSKRLWMTLITIFISVVLICYGFFFYGIRMAIVASFHNFASPVNLYFFTWSHLIFYTVFFLVVLLINNYLVFPLLKISLKKISLSTIKEERDTFIRYKFFIVIIVEMIGPVFLLIIQPFSGTSCYSISCREQYLDFMLVRYIIMLEVLILRIIWSIANAAVQKTKSIMKSYKKFQQKENIFQIKMIYLLKRIEFQSQRQEVEWDLIQQVQYFVYYSIFGTLFPLGALFTFGIGLIRYIMDRINLLYSCKRPIPKLDYLNSIQWMFNMVLHLSIIINIFTIIKINDIYEYDYQEAVKYFVKNIDIESTFIMQVVSTMIFFLIVQFIYYTLRKFFILLTSSQIQERKNNKIDEYSAMRQKEKKGEVDIFRYMMKPIKNIFRAYNPQSAVSNKKKMFKKFKQKYQINDTQKGLRGGILKMDKE